MLWTKCGHFHQLLMLPCFTQCEFTYSISIGKAYQLQILFLLNGIGLSKLKKSYLHLYLFKCINNLQPTFCQKSATAIVKLTATIRDIAVESERMAQRIQVDVDNVNESTASIQEILQNLVMGVKTKPRFENL